MIDYVPSIFNDVIGPVMRGPSSSHTAAAWRIGSLARDMLRGRACSVLVEFDADGSLVETYHTQGSDMGLAAGLLGIPMTDPDAARALALAEGRADLTFRVTDRKAEHPNNYALTLKDRMGEIRFEAVSIGGGMIELRRFQGVPLRLRGDLHEHLALCDDPGALMAELAALGGWERLECHGAEGRKLVRAAALSDRAGELSRLPGACIFHLRPVVSVLSPANLSLPFETLEQYEQGVADNGQPIWQHALAFEAARGGTDERTVLREAGRVLRVMRDAAREGLEAEYSNRVLHRQAHKLCADGPLPSPLLNRAARLVTAVMQAKSAMLPIVAAPTAGSCGCLPGTLLALGEEMGLTEESLIQALLTAGLIGLFFAQRATFAAEEAGCQVECGAASGMTAAAVAMLLGAGARQSLGAASMALQAVSGLACDPVAGRVEVPCLGKNVMAGANALTCAAMAQAGFDPVLPLGETIDALMRIGQSLPRSLRCTLGGLGDTPASYRLAERLSNVQKEG